MTRKTIISLISEIENFNYSNFSNSDYRFLLTKMGELLQDNIKVYIPSYDTKDIRLFRCRANQDDTMFANARNLWHPPEESTPTGRLNFEKNPILYTAHNAATAMIEINAHHHEFITSVEYKIKSDTLNILEFSLNLVTNSQREPIDEISKLIMKFLSREAKKIVPKGQEYKYCPTIIFAKSVSKNDNFDAFAYESVATRNKGLNFAVKSNFAENYLTPVEFRYLRVSEKINQNNFFVQCLSKTVNEEYNLDSELEWIDVNDCKGHKIDSDEFTYH